MLEEGPRGPTGPGAEDHSWDACARPTMRPASPGLTLWRGELTAVTEAGGRSESPPFCQDFTPTAHLFTGEME